MVQHGEKRGGNLETGLPLHWGTSPSRRRLGISLGAARALPPMQAAQGALVAWARTRRRGRGALAIELRAVVEESRRAAVVIAGFRGRLRLGGKEPGPMDRLGLG
jgi:hypothetical protein